MNAHPPVSYKGCLITRSSRWRWESYLAGAGFLYANTLAGMRELISESLT